MKSERLRILRLMRMLAARVDFQLGQHLSTDLVLRQHAADGIVHHLFRAALDAVASFFAALTCVACVPAVGFLIPLVTSELDLVAVGQDHEVARVHVRAVVWLMLTHQNHGDIGCHATNNLVGAIDDVPVLFTEFGICLRVV